MAIAALVIACLAFGTAAWSGISAHRSAGSAKISADEARRSADAAERTAAAEERSAAIAERAEALAVEQRSRASLRVETPPPSSSTSRHSRLLVNDGPATAIDVKLENADPANIAVNPQDWPEIQPRGRVPFAVFQAMGSGTMVRITWTTPDGIPGELTTSVR